MPTSLKQIEAQALALTHEERAKLANTLLESLHPPISEIQQAWGEEIEHRIAAFDRGEIAA